MKNILKYATLSLSLMIFGLAFNPVVTLVGAEDAQVVDTQIKLPSNEINLNEACKDAGNDISACKEKRDFDEMIALIMNTMISIVSLVAVVVIVIAGFKMSASGGSSDAYTHAKNMIIYAVIGLVVAFLAYAIVKYVTDIL